MKRILFERALRRSTTHRYDYLHTYVGDLESVIDLAAIHNAKITLVSTRSEARAFSIGR